MSFGLAVFSLNTVVWLHHIYFGAALLATALVGWWLIERYSAVARGVRWPGRVLVLATAAGGVGGGPFPCWSRSRPSSNG